MYLKYILDEIEMYLSMDLDKAAECKQNAFGKNSNISVIYLKYALSLHAQKLYKPKWVKELWTRQPFKN